MCVCCLLLRGLGPLQNVGGNVPAWDCACGRVLLFMGMGACVCMCEWLKGSVTKVGQSVQHFYAESMCVSVKA